MQGMLHSRWDTLHLLLHLNYDCSKPAIMGHIAATGSTYVYQLPVNCSRKYGLIRSISDDHCKHHHECLPCIIISMELAGKLCSLLEYFIYIACAEHSFFTVFFCKVPFREENA
jgi:hypothetical protein